jgi:predicted membrane-bound spermidine synthase
MQRGIENYEGKDICILGGGDGALLYELLKENPGNVVMLEIDDIVMDACNKYMNSICGDVLEKRKGDNYEVRNANVNFQATILQCPFSDHNWRLYGIFEQVHKGWQKIRLCVR